MNYNNNGYYGGNYPPPGGNYPPPPPYNWQYDPLAQEKKEGKEKYFPHKHYRGTCGYRLYAFKYGFRRAFARNTGLFVGI